MIAVRENMTGFAVNTSRDGNLGFNDLYIDAGGNLVTVSDLEEFIQAIRSSIWLWLGEYNFDTALGVQYSTIFGNPHIPEASITQQLRQAILLADSYLTTDQRAAYGVNSIDSITYVIDRRTRILTANIILVLNNNDTVTIRV